MWPLALANIIREGDDASIWARIHARQALVLGASASVAFIAVLALPLIAVLAIPSISNGATIGVYAVGLVADFVIALAFVLVGIRYSARAARGELFAIPIVTAIVDRWWPVERP